MYISRLPDADVTISMAFDLADYSAKNIQSTHSDFGSVGLSINLRSDWTYPVDERTWIEIAIGFIGGAAYSHYADKFFDALDRLVIKKVRKINLTIKADDRSVGVDLERDDKTDSVKRLEEALKQIEELHNNDKLKGPP